jgi:hypothetical protein
MIKNILVSTVVSVIVTIGVFKVVPLAWLDRNEPNLGATITTIQGTDTLSSSRTTINNNFANLNADKIEISDLVATTTLPNLTTLTGIGTLGTITTGTWNASTVGVGYGGTSIASYTTGDILYASGALTLSKLAIGSNGQSLIIAGGVPTWDSASVNQTANYTWTGSHTFSIGATSSATTTITNSSLTGSPFIINGISYLFPATQGASSTVLATNGSGGLTWNTPKVYTLLNDGTIYSTSNTATTSVKTVSIPANTLGANDSLRIRVLGACSGGNNAKYYDFSLGNGSATTTVFSKNSCATTFPTESVDMTITVNNNNSQSAQSWVFRGNSSATINTGNDTAKTSSIDFSAQTYFSIGYAVVNGADTVAVRNIVIEVIKN